MIRVRLRRRYDLPLELDDSTGLMPWIVALMSFLAALALAGALVLGTLVWRWTEGVSGAFTVLLAPAEDALADGAEARVNAVRQALAALPGVASVEALGAAEVARRLQPWLGSGAAVEELPLPRLLVVRVSGDRRPDLAQMRARLEQAAPGAVVDDHAVWRAAIAQLAARILAVAGAAVALTALASAAVVMFAVRAGLAVHRETVEVLHLIGAHDDYIARQFQSHAARMALRGGAIGLVLLAATEGFLFQAALGLDPSLLPRLDLAAWQWAALASLPGAIVFLGMLAIAWATARFTVRRSLARLV